MRVRRGTSGLNMLLGIDKPVGMTSHDVVARCRRALGERRIGHAGTLDPLASGVMLVGVGAATRLMSFATAQDKRYRARFVFGSETTTDDSEGDVRRVAPVSTDFLSLAWASAQESLLTAMSEQLPPAYSAVQVGGVRSYAAARRGDELELSPRPIRVFEARVVDVGTFGDEGAWWDLDLHVSKGTYIRSLARDLGRMLQSACHVGALRRTASGHVALADCTDLESVVQGGQAGAVPLDPVDVLGCPALAISDDEVRAVRDGKRLSVARTDAGAGRSLAEGELVALVSGCSLYCVARRLGGALVPQAVFADGVVGVCCR